MQKTLAVIHTSLVSHKDLMALFKEYIPNVRIINIIDDSLLAEVSKNRGLTKAIVRRMCKYAEEAELLGADMILNQCSSVGEAAEIAKNVVNIPIVRIDDAMAEKAVSLGKKIAVVATVGSTMVPSVSVVRRAAERAGKQIDITECLIDGALDTLMKGDRETHNRLCREAIEKLEDKVDVIVLAQGSMVVLLDELKHIKKPVLTSPRLAVEKVKELLGE